jgi:hypothetical protein
LDQSALRFATKAEAESSAQQSQSGQEAAAASSSGNGDSNETEAVPNSEELAAKLQERESAIEEMQKKVGT